MRLLGRAIAVTLVVAAGVLAAFRLAAARREVTVAAEAAPGTGRFVQAADVRIFVQEAGDPGAPAVLFVHGTGAWSETWRHTMQSVAAAGFRAAALDLPPFGYSERPDPPRYDKLSQGQRIAGALEALGKGRAILVGHSFGGGPTVEAALLAGGRLRAMVLVDAALGIRPDGAQPTPPPALLAGALALAPLRDALVATFLSNPRFTRRLLQSFVANKAAASDERVAVYQRPLAVTGTTRAIGAWLPELVAPVAAARSEDPAEYRRLTIPVFAIWGDLDTITPPAQGQRLASLVPGAQLVVLEGVGHIPQIEAPERFDAALVKVLRGLEVAGSR